MADTSLPSGGKHASGPLLSIGQMAALCFCLYDFFRECLSVLCIWWEEITWQRI